MLIEDKLVRINSLMKLVAKAETYRDACAHSNFVRGMITAWHSDLTLPSEDYRRLHADLEIIMGVKRNLPMQGDVV